MAAGRENQHSGTRYGVQASGWSGTGTAPLLTHSELSPRQWRAETLPPHVAPDFDWPFVPADPVVEQQDRVARSEDSHLVAALLAAERSACFAQREQQGASADPELASRSLTVRQPAAAGLSAYSSGWTWFASAQAQRSAVVKQQQCRQHSSALWQPQT